MNGPTWSDVPADTAAEAATAQEALLGALTPAERMATALELSETARAFALSGLENRHPDLSDRELRKRLIELCYGSLEDR